MGKLGKLSLNLLKLYPKMLDIRFTWEPFFEYQFIYLKQQGICAVGTIRNNLLYGADKLMQNQKKLQKKGGDLLTTW